MLQREIVVKALGKQIDTEYPEFTKYTIINYHSIAWMLIFDIVTINRNAAVIHGYENNHCITTPKLLWRCI